MIKERGKIYSSAFPIRLAMIINVLQRETDTLVESLWVSYPVGNLKRDLRSSPVLQCSHL